MILARACVELEDRRRAAIVYDRLSAFAGRNVLTADRHCWGAADRYLGLLAGVLDHPDEAVAHMEAAIDLNRRMGASAWLAHTRLTWRSSCGAGAESTTGIAVRSSGPTHLPPPRRWAWWHCSERW